MADFTIDVRAGTTPFPHYWERCVGSCHALMGLREDWRRQLKKCHEELGFQYVRFHGLLNDDMSVYVRGAEGPRYSFFNVDSIFDYLVQIGMKPFVELSFMPRGLASGGETCFHYLGNVTPPKDYAAWAALIRRLIDHLIGRYGRDEVRSWYFEVWNEPNLDYFWHGTQEEYFALYRHTVRAIKEVDPYIPVGGPATAANGWIPEMLSFCRQNGLPLDFISTHHYPTDAVLGHGLNMEEQMARSERGMLGRMAARARHKAADLPLYYTEWNCSPGCRNHYQDETYAAAFIVKTIADNQGLVDIYSFWTFSDLFEEDAFPSLPFHGGFGLLNLHGIPKPTYRAFQLLHHLGTERMEAAPSAPAVTVEVLATKSAEAVQILVYNHNIPQAPIEEEEVTLIVKGLAPDINPAARIERIDERSANPKGEWLRMDSPEYPDQAMLARLMQSSEMRVEELTGRIDGGELTFRLAIPPHGVAALTLPGARV